MNTPQQTLVSRWIERIPWAGHLSKMHRPTGRRFRIIFISALVGVLSGLAAAALYGALRVGVEHIIGQVVHLGGSAIFNFRIELLLLPAFGGLLSGFIVRSSPGQGTDALVRSFHYQNGRMKVRGPLTKASAAVGVISFGGSAGPEGPIAALGAALGSSVGRAFHLPPRDRRILLISGCAGGVGAIFGCPLGGALFATSVLYSEPEFESESLVSAFIASVVSYSVFMAIWGGRGFLLDDANTLSFHGLGELPIYLLLGLACAAAAAFLSACIDLVETARERITLLPVWMLPAIGGALTGLVACAMPQVMDNEYFTIQNALDGSFFGGAVGAGDWGYWFLFFTVLVAAKCLATAFTVGSGGAGGLLGPSVFIGGVVGAAMGAGLQVFDPGFMTEGLRAALIPVGMAGVLAAAMRIPLASMVMVVEMTGSYGLIVPLMLVTMTAYMVGGRWGLVMGQVRTSSDSPAHAGDAVVHMLESEKVRDVMDRDWAYLATPSTTLGEMLSTIRTGERPYFVVHKNREPVGIISVTDIADFADEPLMADMVIAADIMTSDIYVIAEEDSLYEALTVFRERKVEVLPVVAGHGGRAMEGLLTRRKVFRLVASQMERLRETTLKEHAGLGMIEEDTQMAHLLSGLPAPELGDVQRMQVPRELVGQTLASANYRAEYGGEVLAIQTVEGSFLCPADPRRELDAGDQLIVISSPRKS